MLYNSNNNNSVSVKKTHLRKVYENKADDPAWKKANEVAKKAEPAKKRRRTDDFVDDAFNTDISSSDDDLMKNILFSIISVRAAHAPIMAWVGNPMFWVYFPTHRVYFLNASGCISLIFCNV